MGVPVLRPDELASARKPLTPMRLQITRDNKSGFEAGRRKWLQYLDVGFSEASGGRVQAKFVLASGAENTHTGWHYHECEIQIAFVMTGWVDLHFEDGTVTRLEAGDIALIPGGTRHNEVGTSPDMSGLEVTVPGGMGTVPCSEPDGWKPLRRV